MKTLYCLAAVTKYRRIILKIMNNIFFKLKNLTLQKTFFIIILSLFFYSAQKLNCEILYSPSWGYSLDLPEGFVLVEKNDSDKYLFQHSIQPVDLQIILYTKAKYKNIESLSENIFSQMDMTHQDMNFIWCENKCLFSLTSFNLSGQNKKIQMAGWVLIIELNQEKGWLVLFSYTESTKAKECEALMISALDSVFINEISYIEPGPITSVLYPKKGEENISYDFNGKKINIVIDKSDFEAGQSVIDREFSLLTTYLKTNYVEKAWQRYYKMIFRDSWRRILPISFAVNLELKSKNKLNANQTAAEILKLLQGFTYTRQQDGSDFINLTQTFIESTGDCDSRSLLMVLILKQLGIDSILLVSPKHAHALSAVKISGDGAFFEYNGKRYLIAETTAKVKIGQIAQDMANLEDWFPVEFYGFNNPE